MKTTSIHDSIQPSGSLETSATQMLDCLLTPFRAVDRKNWGWEPGPTNVAQDCATGDKPIFLFPKADNPDWKLSNRNTTTYKC